MVKPATPAKTLSKSQRLTRDTWDKSLWPFTVKAVTLKVALVGLVVNQKIFEITITPARKTYGLNGIAQERYPDFRPIWLNDPDKPGQKIDVTALIEYAQEMFWDASIKPD
jgi:hypothetical protein